MAWSIIKLPIIRRAARIWSSSECQDARAAEGEIAREESPIDDNQMIDNIQDQFFTSRCRKRNFLRIADSTPFRLILRSLTSSEYPLYYSILRDCLSRPWRPNRYHRSAHYPSSRIRCSDPPSLSGASLRCLCLHLPCCLLNHKLFTYAQALQVLEIYFPKTLHTGNLVIIDEELFQERHIDVGEHFNRTEFALSDDESCQGLEADVRQDRDHCRLLDRG